MGADTRSELILMCRLVEKYDIDVVVVGFLMNDLHPNSLHGVEDEKEVCSSNYGGYQVSSWEDDAMTAGSARSRIWSRIWSSLLVHNTRETTLDVVVLANRIAASIDAFYLRLYLASRSSNPFRTPLTEGRKRKLEITESLFERMATYCNRTGKKLIVLSIPQEFQVLYARQRGDSEDIDVALLDRYFANRAKQNGFTWITTLDAFKKSGADTRELFYRFDGHLRPAGSKVLAAVFLQRVVPMIDALSGGVGKRSASVQQALDFLNRRPGAATSRRAGSERAPEPVPVSRGLAVERKPLGGTG